MKHGPKLFSIAVEGLAAGGWQRLSEYPGKGASPGEHYVTRRQRMGENIVFKVLCRDGSPVRFDRVRATVALPLLNYAHTVVPDCGRHYVNASKALDIRAPLYRVTASNAGHPFFAVADESGAFMLAFGIVSRTGEVEARRILPRISRRKAMVGGDELLSIEFSWVPVGTGPALTLDFFMCDKASTWFHALRAYTDAIKERERIEYPSHPAAWEPAWCTWTAFPSSEMTADRVIENARIARAMGIGTIILDDGWFGTGLDDDEGVQNMGDFEPARAKFHDLSRHVDDLHGLGLKVLLWHAPLCVADTSLVYNRMRRYLMRQEGREVISVNGLHMLCPACPEVRDYVASETERLLRSYHVDGLKVDLYNCLPVGPCTATEHGHDVPQGVDAVEAVMAAQWAKARETRPDVFCELKQDYGNVRFLRHGTHVRAGDTAYDVDTNIRRCFYIQAYAGCVHNDYFVTSVHAVPESYAQAMIRMLAAGVPTFGMNLVNLPKAARAVLAAWLGFYNARRTIFKAPREPQNNNLDVWQGGDRRAAWVAALWNARELRLPAASVVTIMNGTANADLIVRTARTRRLRATARDFALRLVRRGMMSLADGTRLAIPPGGMVELEGCR